MELKLALCNTTGWAAAKSVLEVTDAGVVFLQEHRLLGDSLPAAQDWAAKAGWQVPAAGALPGRRGKTCAGAAVAVRTYVGTRIFPGLKSGGAAPAPATLVRGRAAGVTALTLAPGGIHLVSAYFKDGAGLRGENAQLMEQLSEHLHDLEGPLDHRGRL